MARDILSGFGPDYTSPKESTGSSGLTSGGGKPEVKSLPYSAPVGPSNINDSKSPGLHGDNCGPCGTQGRH